MVKNKTVKQLVLTIDITHNHFAQVSLAFSIFSDQVGVLRGEKSVNFKTQDALPPPQEDSLHRVCFLPL